VTNKSGGVMTGLVGFERTLPTATDTAQPGGLPQAVVNIRRFAAYIPSISYTAKVPPGYALRATANMGQVSTHTPSGPDQYHSSWSSLSLLSVPRLEFAKPGEPPRPRRLPPPSPSTAAELQAQRTALEAQFQELQDQGRISVILGQPKLLFSVTNNAGEPFQGFLELVGPESGMGPGGLLPRSD
jgi:hypothetical protein